MKNRFPSVEALERARDCFRIEEDGNGRYTLYLFANAYTYNDEFSVLQARERLVTLMALVLDDFATETMLRHSWDPVKIQGQG